MRISTPLPYLALALALALAPAAPAETHLFLENRGDDHLCVEGTTMSGGLAGWAWRQPRWDGPPAGSAFLRGDCRYLLGPGARVEFLRLNDDQGVTDGHSFWFETTLRSPGGQRIVLEHKLDGETIGSNLWRRVADSPFVDDDRTRRHAWLTAGGVRQVESGEDDGDLYYRVAAAKPGPSPLQGRSPGDIELMTWNLGLLPGGDADRVGRQMNHMTGPDVLVLTEVFLEEAKKRIRRSLAGWYPYWTTGLGSDGLIGQDGGVMILSRWPILFQDEVVFGGGRGSDALADKGALYARIAAPFGTLHVVGTHTQSEADDLASALVDGPLGGLAPSPVRIRQRQFSRIRSFLERMELPPGEPVLIAGDLNVPRASNERSGMLESLRAAQLDGDVEGPTWDPANTLVDDDARAERLDYVLHLRDHRAPVTGEVEVLRPRWEGRDLSDHYAVVARMRFALPGASVPPPPARRGPGGWGIFGLGW
jgi:endonuclease/exonuclease/phosphatase family metal-dependent hydrolase